MKKLFFICTLALLAACSDSDDYEGSSDSYWINLQNTMYNDVMSNIYGHWVGSEELTNGTWTTRNNIVYEFTFNTDNTYIEKSGSTTYEGTFTIEKNPDYVENHTSAIYSILTLDRAIPASYSIWIDVDGRLRLDRISTLGTATSSTTRYTKE